MSLRVDFTVAAVAERDDSIALDRAIFRTLWLGRVAIDEPPRLAAASASQ